MASNGVAALNALLQEMQALMGILPVAMVPVAPRMSMPEPGRPAHEVAAEMDARTEAGFDNMPV
ncbi:MAG TPA: hypothetical protein PLH11_12390 [Gemmobacter sp.]|nr:hypothetical protein [Gemmobacter sp.]